MYSADIPQHGPRCRLRLRDKWVGDWTFYLFFIWISSSVNRLLMILNHSMFVPFPSQEPPLSSPHCTWRDVVWWIRTYSPFFTCSMHTYCIMLPLRAFDEWPCPSSVNVMIWKSMSITGSRVGVITCISATIEVCNADQLLRFQTKVCLSSLGGPCSAGILRTLIFFDSQDSSPVGMYFRVTHLNLMDGSLIGIHHLSGATYTCGYWSEMG